MKSRINLLAPLLALALAAGCSTPSARIRKNPDLFAKFPPAAQEKIRKGEVDVGFTAEMVEMALGKPARVYRRKAATGETEVWSYVDLELVPGGGEFLPTTYYVRGSDGRVYPVNDMVWADLDRRREFERLRIEFQGGKAIAIESLKE